jgi:hypothetical protein
LLATGAPGVSQDLIDGYLNERYEQLLEACKWVGRNYHAMVQTTAAYQSTTDSVNLTVGSNAVTGVLTTWTAAATNGMTFYAPGDTVVYTFTWLTATSGTLDRPYEGNGTDAPGTQYANAGYVFMQDIYQLPADVDTIIEMLNPVTGFPLERMSNEQLDRACGTRTLVQDPVAWALYDDTNENISPPPVHQVRFYPPPLNARGIPLEYAHVANGWDGSSTNAGPLPFVSSSALLAGCRASIETYLASKTEGAAAAAHTNASKTYLLEWNVEYNRLLLVEFSQRRKKLPMRMASRFTRHRVGRAAQGMLNYWRGGIPGGPT